MNATPSNTLATILFNSLVRDRGYTLSEALAIVAEMPDWQPPTIDSYNAIIDLSISESDLLTNEDLALEMYQATMKAHREGHDLDCQMITRNGNASMDDLTWSQMARRMAMVQDIVVSHILFGFKKLTPFVRFGG